MPLIGLVHTSPEKFLKTALFLLTIRPTVHTNPSPKRSFLKTLLKPEEFGNPRFVFSVDGKKLKTELFENALETGEI